MKKLILPIVLISVLSLTLLPSLVLAQGALERLADVQATADLPEGSLESTIGLIINIILSLVGVILVVLIVYAGFLWMTAGGNEDNIKKAKAILTNSIIGLIITLLAYGIARFVLEGLLEATM
ncbi:MAG: hypothetical protein U9P90_03805 [Patescibacteria group bacterium]|nr:hypothetical protein [Patescibacteria group bacterium]